MKEFIVDLISRGAGSRTKVRVFASCPASAVRIAKGMYPIFNIGAVKPANN
jgi:hypothetical protein